MRVFRQSWRGLTLQTDEDFVLVRSAWFTLAAVHVSRSRLGAERHVEAPAVLVFSFRLSAAL